jgi:phage I-like protein
MNSGHLVIALNQADADLSAALALCAQLPTDGKTPDWIELIPAGRNVKGQDGRAWINDRPEAVLAAFNAAHRPLPLDLEHSTEKQAPQGLPAPAVGWLEELQVREGGAIWGRVNWTPQGQDLVTNRAYRFVSPVFLHERASGRIVKLTSAALTNQPNLSLTALNRAGGDLSSENKAMYEQLLQALGLRKTATEAEAVAAVDKLKADLTTAQNREATPSLDKYVPRSDYDQAVTRASNAEKALQDHETKARDAQIEAEIAQALKDKKITPATADYHRAACREEGGLKRFQEFAKAAPVVAPDSGLDGKDASKGANGGLSPEQLAICTAMAIAPEDYKKALA